MTIYILPFEKMHGTGNDFIILERRHLPNGVNDSVLAKVICNRNYSIGADGIIIMDLSPTRDADFKWDYYNSDGSIGEMCGNGMRCFAKYVYEKGFTNETAFSVITKAGIIKPVLEADGTVTVDMGIPNIPDKNKKQLEIEGKKISYFYVETGNPHCVIFQSEEINNHEFYNYGPKIEKHKNFPNGINVEFAKIVNKGEILLRVWERGAGPTLACGTGACATVVAGCSLGLSENKVKVYLPGGMLSINWDQGNKHVYLNGETTFVYAGQLNLDLKLICV